MTTITVEPASQELRRRLGPTGWVVLEDLLLDAEPDTGGRLVVVSNVRRLAANLGLSKDTCARALGRLIDAGLVERMDGGRGAGGRFSRGCYVLHPERVTGVTLTSTQSSTRRRAASPATSRPARATVLVEQASLFAASLSETR